MTVIEDKIKVAMKEWLKKGSREMLSEFSVTAFDIIWETPKGREIVVDSLLKKVLDVDFKAEKPKKKSKKPIGRPKKSKTKPKKEVQQRTLSDEEIAQKIADELKDEPEQPVKTQPVQPIQQKPKQDTMVDIMMN